MKYIVILGDGMADHPVPELNGLTPLQAANKPHMDFIAKHGRCGLVRTIPENMAPGSDIANLSVMGYDPAVYYTGRASLEAISMGIELNPGDLSYRCNMVCLSDAGKYEDSVMVDYCAGEIPTEESRILAEALARELGIELHPGFSYRHCLVLRGALPGAELTPPHDISGKPVKPHMPRGHNAELFTYLMKRSYEILANHPVNIQRARQNKRPANSAWFWGEGRSPSLPSFYDKYGVNGSVISAVDLIKGIGISAGLENIHVPGATGNINTDYEGKVSAALNALTTRGFVYLHIEAPDECGHRGEIRDKVRAIELIDQRVIGPVMSELDRRGEPYSIMVLPDHATPLDIKTHTDEAVPFAYYRSTKQNAGSAAFDEQSAAQTGVFINEGYRLMDEFIDFTCLPPCMC